MLEYDTGSANTVLDLKGSVNNFQIQNNTTPILTLNRSTGNLTLTGDLTADNVVTNNTLVSNHVRAGNTQIWNGSTPSFGTRVVTDDLLENTWNSYKSAKKKHKKVAEVITEVF